jgi:hypothetical protein
MAKITTPTPLSLLISSKLSFQIVGLEMSSLHTLALKSHNKILIYYLGNLSMFHFLVEVFLHINFVLCSGMNDRLCGLVVRVSGCRSKSLGSIPSATRFSEK